MGINTFTLVVPLHKAVPNPPDPARWNSGLSHLNSSNPASLEPCPAASCSLTLWVSHPSGRAEGAAEEESRALAGWERNVREILPFGNKNVGTQIHPGLALHEEPHYGRYLQCYFMHDLI